MTDKIQEQIKELAELVEPLQKFILENYHPHSEVVVTLDDVKVNETMLGIPQVYEVEGEPL